MAHLEVERKPGRPWWTWVLLAIILVALAAMLFRKCSADPVSPTNAVIKDKPLDALATSTAPDWTSIDFNSEATSDEMITDADISTRFDGKYTIYSLGENILFPTDRNEISPKGDLKLKMISDVLNKRFAGATIGVFGSTDATGPADQNKELGKDRAISVKNWLVTSGKIPAETISIQSLGENQPIATNQTEKGRKQNRNVSIVVFQKL